MDGISFNRFLYSRASCKTKKSQNDQNYLQLSCQRSFSHTRIQALYLQAWLACQLGWHFKKISHRKDQTIIEYNQDIVVHLIPTSHAMNPPGLMSSVDLITDEEEHFNFERNLKCIHHITLNVFTPTHCDLPTRYVFAKAESGHSLVKEICHKGTSEHFLKVINLMKKMNTGRLMLKKTLDERRLLIVPGDTQTTLHYCADHLISCASEAIKNHGLFAVALSGGSTPKAIFELLGEDPTPKKSIGPKSISSWGDERSVPPDHPDSNYRMAMATALRQNAHPQRADPSHAR